MTSLIRDWLLGITGVAILAALAESLMARSAAGYAGKLVCGLTLLIAVLRPLCGLPLSNFYQEFGPGSFHLQQDSEQLQLEHDLQLRDIIEHRLEAYSVEQAKLQGIDCDLNIQCAKDENGIFLPVSAQVFGLLLPNDQKKVMQGLIHDLGLPSHKITFQEDQRP